MTTSSPCPPSSARPPAQAPPPSSAGLVPPAPGLGGVTEVRVHGVGGTRPQHLLGTAHPVRVAGDDIAGFYRRDDAGGRHIEAYSWGGLTSRSTTRVLWLLLLPFMLANLAGWMGPPELAGPGRLPRAYRAVMRWAALAVTLDVVLLIAWIPVDYVGYQCGARPACTGAWWLVPFRGDLVQDFPGRRIVMAAAVPLLAVALLAVLTLRSIRRYEAVRPPRVVAPPPGAAGQEGTIAGAAALPGGLAHPAFWDGAPCARRLCAAHIAASLALTATLIAYPAHAVSLAASSAPGPLSVLWWPSIGAAGVALAGAVVLLLMERERRWRPRLTIGTVAVAVLAPVLAAGYAWGLPASAPGPRAAELPGMRDLLGAAYTVIIVSVALIAILLLARALTWRRALRWAGFAAVAAGALVWLSRTDPFPLARAAVALALLIAIAVDGERGGPGSGRFRWCAPFVVLAVGLAVLNTVMLGVLIRVADLVGNIGYGLSAPARLGEQTGIAVFPMVQYAVSYLIVVPGAVLGLFAVWQLVRYARARRAAPEVREEYRERERERPLPEPEATWYASALEQLPGGRPPAAWAGDVAGMRRLARAVVDVDLALSGMVAVGMFLIALLEARYWSARDHVDAWLVGIGATIAALLPLAVVAVMWAGWRDLGRRRALCVLWDIGTFWPRSFHPLAPPCYGERAVPDLQRRMWWLHDNGGQVLVNAHSQGTVLAAAALLQRERRPAGARNALVTFGSPLRKLYQWGFPAYFTPAALRDLDHLPWANVYYATDPIGGPIGAPCDVCLPDPRTSRYLYGDAAPPIGGHTGYWTDPAFWQVVDKTAAALAVRA